MSRERAAALHARMRGFDARVNHARAFLRDALTQCERPYVACSFGKDSSVALDLALQVRPEIDVRCVTHPETEYLGNYDQIVEAWRQRAPGIRIALVHVHREALEEPRPHTQANALAEAGHDGYVVGLRAEESAGRRLSLRAHGTAYRNQAGVLRISPLAWWSTMDVAAYIVSRGLPLLEAYREHGWDARTTTGIPGEAKGIRARSMSELKQQHPERFNALAALYPEIRAYA